MNVFIQFGLNISKVKFSAIKFMYNFQNHLILFTLFLLCEYIGCT